jgi:hypothetical protein
MVLSIEECVFRVEYVFREGNRSTDSGQEQFAEKFPETPVPNRNAHNRCLCTSLLTLFISAQRLSKCTVLQNKKHSTSKTEIPITFNYSQNNHENAVCQICCVLTQYSQKINYPYKHLQTLG